jgi:hypothetical protein
LFFAGIGFNQRLEAQSVLVYSRRKASFSMFPQIAKSAPLVLIPAALALMAAGCSRPQPTAEQLAGPTTPLTALHLGPTPPGGSSEAPTGAGAGGSAAGGYQFGRIGSTLESPTLPDQPAGITYSRMSPVGSSGSGNGDRGNPIPPDVSLAAPPDPAPKQAPRFVPGVKPKMLPTAKDIANLRQGMTVTATIDSSTGR